MGRAIEKMNLVAHIHVPTYAHAHAATMRIESIKGGHRTNKTVRRTEHLIGTQTRTRDVPGLNEDGSRTHQARAPVPEEKAERYLHWRQTRQPGETTRFDNRAPKKQMKHAVMRQCKHDCDPATGIWPDTLDVVRQLDDRAK